MSAHSAAHTCSVTLQNLNFFLLALPSLICITHRINMVITTCLGFSHKGSPLTLHRLVCALQVTCVRYLLVCKRRICARGEGPPRKSHPLASAGCAVTLTNTCTLPTLHVIVHTLPTHLLLATRIATKNNLFQ